LRTTAPASHYVFKGLFGPETRFDRIETGFWIFDRMRFLDAKRFPPRIKSAAGFGFDGALIDELRAEFVTDPPRQPALPRAALRQNDGELRGHLEVLGDDLHPAIRYVRDRAVARQRSGPELDSREPSAHTAFAQSSIRKHVGPSSLADNASPGIASDLQMNRWNRPSGTARNLIDVSDFFLPIAFGSCLEPP
jgi:hypothetical protein